ncbi:CHC2 zinc finger domain-containing protein [Streptomyces sp. CC219B]|uniref:CHC2 zinc finger domain-containing protein n=1 Tax=Streptomyces sp. CC219B TaxID=3044574 RepID=UPI0024A8473A|nr:CHC2 zinc finger domain-containing protein [Streptomyces sp. CC219B]
MKFRRIDNDRQDPEHEKPTLEAVFEHYDIDFNSARATGMSHCPFHEDDTPSFSWNTDRQVWKCHSCQEAGDSYTLIMKKEKTDFVGAKRFAASLALATRDAGRGDERVSGSAYTSRRAIPARSGDRPGRGGYTPAWRRR